MIANKSILTTIILLFIISLLITPSEAQTQNIKYRNHSLQSQQDQNTLCRVKKGDCLWKIAQRHNFKLNQIIKANPHFKDPDLIYPNDKVFVPPQGQEMKQPQETTEDQRKQDPPQNMSPESNNEMQNMKRKVFDLVNQERQNRGLKPYKYYNKLAHVAQKKAKDMRDNNYFSHQSPTYGSPFEMLEEFGIEYSAAGENIARGQRSAEEVMNSWMNSPGHRKNILSKKYTHIGVGLAQNKQNTNYWVQMFIRK